MLSLLLKNIRKNPFTGNYEAREAAYSYSIPESLINELTEYLKEHPTHLIADWYRSLEEPVRVKVTRKGIYE